MRIITGKYKGAKLFAVPGISTRPTTDFNREVIFSMYPDYQDKRVLDLFAGTGSFGLECLSRGAAWVDFVEFASPAIGVLLQNIQKLGCEQQCHVYRRKAQSYLTRELSPYDVIFLDPPYNKGLLEPCLKAIFTRGSIASGGLVIAEHSPKEALPRDLDDYLVDQKAGKITCFSIWQYTPETDQHIDF